MVSGGGRGTPGLAIDRCISNFFLDAKLKNKACGKSPAVMKHKDTISDEDKQQLGNFVLCLQKASAWFVLFQIGTDGALCFFNWDHGDFCKFSWKICFEPGLDSLYDLIYWICRKAGTLYVYKAVQNSMIYMRWQKPTWMWGLALSRGRMVRESIVVPSF